MPKLNIDQFDEAPSVGDKVKVLGKVKSIDQDSGEVDVSYDEVSIVNPSKKKNHKSTYDKNNTNDSTEYADMQMQPNSQSLDEALAKSFPNTQ